MFLITAALGAKHFCKCISFQTLRIFKIINPTGQDLNVRNKTKCNNEMLPLKLHCA
ncbi:MAG: hypothetical protein QGH34_02135 [Candidatus Woesearchaeota archaeon]|nr:hypothetical protein [Candidatus Woesearchaeota archaeon]